MRGDSPQNNFATLQAPMQEHPHTLLLENCSTIAAKILYLLHPLQVTWVQFCSLNEASSMTYTAHVSMILAVPDNLLGLSISSDGDSHSLQSNDTNTKLADSKKNYWEMQRRMKLLFSESRFLKGKHRLLWAKSNNLKLVLEKRIWSL